MEKNGKNEFLYTNKFCASNFIRCTNIQYILFVLAFLTLGVGDGVTGAILMQTKGVVAESNIIASYIYSTHGAVGFITLKVCITFFLLVLIKTIYKRTNGKSYWMINGLLVALFIVGLLAMQANINAVSGLPHMSPARIIFIYLCMVLALVEAGNIIDNLEIDPFYALR